MKTIRRFPLFLTLSLASFLLTACPSPEPEPVPDPDPTLQVSVSSIDVAAEGDSQTVNLSANFDWTAKASDSWIQVSPASGSKGNASLTIRIEPNTSGQARKASVSVSCRTLTRTISISQAANLTQALVIKHENASFRIPVISGSGLTGKVNWGDGAEEAYSTSLSHNYSAAGSHTVTLRLSGGTAFEMSLAGVTEIDVTDF